MNPYPNPALIEEVAIENGLSPSYIEKDWFVVRTIKLIASISEENILPIFSGGTSLSKGYGVIQRFSEDIDFKVRAEKTLSRSERKNFRSRVIELINNAEALSVIEDSLVKRNESKFFGFDIIYPQNALLEDSLRPYIKLEMSFQETNLETEKRKIRSFISEYLGQEEDTVIECVSTIEIAADKISALAWRLCAINQERREEKFDPTIMRHLHDLSALKTMIIKDPRFIMAIDKSFNNDRGRGGTDSTLSISEMLNQTIKVFEGNQNYQKNYEKFVDNMSYANDEDVIGYQKAFEDFIEIVEHLTSK
jgi:predicted nucleotidyltransferase component of viral defense system